MWIRNIVSGDYLFIFTKYIKDVTFSFKKVFLFLNKDACSKIFFYNVTTALPIIKFIQFI